MPSFNPHKTVIQLSVADLGRATTSNPCTQQGYVVSDSIRTIAEEFTRGSKDGTLTETPLCAHNGECSNDINHLEFLGEHGNMPFCMVHSGQHFFDASTKERRNRRPARLPEPGKAKGKSKSGSNAIDVSEDGKAPLIMEVDTRSIFCSFHRSQSPTQSEL